MSGSLGMSVKESWSGSIVLDREKSLNETKMIRECLMNHGFPLDEIPNGLVFDQLRNTYTLLYPMLIL